MNDSERRMAELKRKQAQQQAKIRRDADRQRQQSERLRKEMSANLANKGSKARGSGENRSGVRKKRKLKPNGVKTKPRLKQDAVMTKGAKSVGEKRTVPIKSG